MTTPTPTAGAPAPRTVRMPRRWYAALGALGAVLGVAAGLLVRPAVAWLLGLVDGAPGPLRLAAQLPVPVAAAVLAVVGLVLGLWVAEEWGRANPVVTVLPEALVVRSRGSSVRVDRSDVAGIVLDEPDLVVRDRSGGEPVRVPADTVIAGRLAAALTEHGYPWLGTSDPLEAEFVPWVDRAPDLDDAAHAALRDRARALADKRPGAADAARDVLHAQGVVVRDRRDRQEYRRV